MAATSAAISGLIYSAVGTGVAVHNANEQADASAKQAEDDRTQQTKLYSDMKQQSDNQTSEIAARNQAESQQASNMRNAAGAASTILTSPLGLSTSDSAAPGKKTLLGM